MGATLYSPYLMQPLQVQLNLDNDTSVSLDLYRCALNI